MTRLYGVNFSPSRCEGGIIVLRYYTVVCWTKKKHEHSCRSHNHFLSLPVGTALFVFFLNHFTGEREFSDPYRFQVTANRLVVISDMMLRQSSAYMARHKSVDVVHQMK